MQLELDLTKTPAQNAEDYYAKARKLKKKIEGIRLALVKFQKELEAEEKKESKKAVKKQVEEVELEKKWYHKFNWFVSSAGFLCIGGRDATTNDMVVKKHVDKNDLVFHTEMSGSPFFVVKSEDKKVDEETIKESAVATASFSRAWKQGLSSIEVYYVTPDQVSKEAKSGEYLGKGAFMIYGKKKFLRAELELAIGLKPVSKITSATNSELQTPNSKLSYELMCGPVSAVKKHCKTYLILKQGDTKASDAAKIIKKFINVGLDDIIRVLPAGNFHVEIPI